MQRLPLIGGPRAKEFSAFADRLKRGANATNAFIGSKHFHRCDYYSHHRPGFATTVRMYSKVRVVCCKTFGGL